MATLLYDTFTDTDATALASHTMNTGAGWTVRSGGFTINSNRARTSGAGTSMATADAGSGDAQTTCIIQLDNTGEEMGLVGRYQDTTHLWHFFWGDGVQKLREYDGNVSNPVRASQSLSLSATTDYTFTVILNGTSLSFQIDSNTALTYTSSVYQAETEFGMVGFLADAARYVRFENFLVSSLTTTHSATATIAATSSLTTVGKNAFDYVGSIAGASSLTAIGQITAAAALTQEGYRWRNDDGAESAATWKANQDTTTSIANGENIRLRMLVDATGDTASSAYQLEFRKSGSSDAWEKVNLP